MEKGAARDAEPGGGAIDGAVGAAQDLIDVAALHLGEREDVVAEQVGRVAIGAGLEGEVGAIELGGAAGEEEDLLEEVAWRIEEECKDKGIPLPRDLPPHHLLADPEA